MQKHCLFNFYSYLAEDQSLYCPMDDMFLLRFLRARKFDTTKTVNLVCFFYFEKTIHFYASVIFIYDFWNYFIDQQLLQHASKECSAIWQFVPRISITRANWKIASCFGTKGRVWPANIYFQSRYMHNIHTNWLLLIFSTLLFLKVKFYRKMVSRYCKLRWYFSFKLFTPGRNDLFWGNSNLWH